MNRDWLVLGLTLGGFQFSTAGGETAVLFVESKWTPSAVLSGVRIAFWFAGPMGWLRPVGVADLVNEIMEPISWRGMQPSSGSGWAVQLKRVCPLRSTWFRKITGKNRKNGTAERKGSFHGQPETERERETERRPWHGAYRFASFDWWSVMKRLHMTINALVHHVQTGELEIGGDRKWDLNGGRHWWQRGNRPDWLLLSSS